MTKRQDSILSVLSKVPVTADVGCDHGKLSLAILQLGLSQQVVATDISQLCLDKTIKLLDKFNLSSKAQYYCLDGMPQIKVDQVLIAGMGGLEIIDILAKYLSYYRPNYLVLQPMRDESKVRQFLVDNGYKIIVDKVIYDKKFYTIIKAETGAQKLTNSEILLGAIKSLYSEQDYQLWLEYMQEKLSKINQKLQENDSKFKQNCKILKLIQDLKEKDNVK